MEAGWYRNPKEPGVLRYWDGNAWTEQKTHKSDGSRGERGEYEKSARRTRIIGALAAAGCVTVVALFLTTINPAGDGKNGTASTSTADPKNFDSATKTVFGSSADADVTSLTGMSEEYFLSDGRSIILGVGQNIIDQLNPDSKEVTSKVYWTNIFRTPDSIEEFSAYLDRIVGTSGKPRKESSIRYMGQDLDGYTVSFAPSNDPVVSEVNVSYYAVDDDSLVVVRTIPGVESVVLTPDRRGTSGAWASDVQRRTGWLLTGVALQPRLDARKMSGATHTATATFKVPSSVLDKTVSDLKSGIALGDFANLPRKMGTENTGAFVFYRASTKISVSVSSPEPDDKEATIVISFDVKAP